MSESGAERREAVGRLYEEHPYPDHGVVGSTVARMAAKIVDPSSNIRILDAGCGTGEQTLGLARAFARAEVIGVDMNDASLDRARHHASRHGLAARFVRVDLLADAVPDLGRFELITSVGVLHHLVEPSAGLATLRAMATDHAHLLGMVYGRFGKQPMFAERDALEHLAGSDSRSRLAAAESRRVASSERAIAAVQELLRRSRHGPELPVVELVRRAVAGRGRAFTADSYAHPQEMAFTWSEVDSLLEGAGWVFEGWPPRSGMPDRADRLFRGETARQVEALGLLDRAHVYERLVRPANLYFVGRAGPVHC